MEKHLILGIHLTNRLLQAQDVQALFTQYGCHIKTRLGLHEVNNVCSPGGIILLEMHGDEAPCMEFAGKLNQIEGVEVQSMKFSD